MPEDELLGTMDMGKRSSGDVSYGRDAALGNNVAFDNVEIPSITISAVSSYEAYVDWGLANTTYMRCTRYTIEGLYKLRRLLLVRECLSPRQ
jgi:hypothetical protein